MVPLAPESATVSVGVGVLSLNYIAIKLMDFYYGSGICSGYSVRRPQGQRDAENNVRSVRPLVTVPVHQYHYNQSHSEVIPVPIP